MHFESVFLGEFCSKQVRETSLLFADFTGTFFLLEIVVAALLLAAVAPLFFAMVRGRFL